MRLRLLACASAAGAIAGLAVGVVVLFARVSDMRLSLSESAGRRSLQASEQGSQPDISSKLSEFEQRLAALEGRETTELWQLRERLRTLEQGSYRRETTSNSLPAESLPLESEEEPTEEEKRAAEAETKAAAARESPQYRQLLSYGFSAQSARAMQSRVAHWETVLSMLQREGDEQRIRQFHSSVRGYCRGTLTTAEVELFAAQYHQLWGPDDIAAPQQAHGEEEAEGK